MIMFQSCTFTILSIFYLFIHTFYHPCIWGVGSSPGFRLFDAAVFGVNLRLADLGWQFQRRLGIFSPG